MTDEQTWDFSSLKALFINCTLKKGPEKSNTEGLVDISAGIMKKHGVDVEIIRAIDQDIATGVYPDMREHGWQTDEWPELYKKVQAADILVIAGPIWLGDNSSVTKRIIERLYSNSSDLNKQGQYAYYGKVGGCLITGNEDGGKHCSMNILYSLQHIGYTIPPQADSYWVGAAGPGPERGRDGLRRRSGRGGRPGASPALHRALLEHGVTRFLAPRQVGCARRLARGRPRRRSPAPGRRGRRIAPAGR